MLRNRWFIGSEVRYLHFWHFVFIVLKSSKWRNKFNTTEKGEIEKKKAIKKEWICKIGYFTLRKRSSYRPKAALLQCKTAAFASYLSYIYAEIVCKIGRKSLVLPHKQAVFVAQYYPISVQQLAFQRLKVARKKSENLQKLLPWCRKVPVISELRLWKLTIRELI